MHQHHSRIRRVAFFLLSFTSIAALLTHLPGWVSMAVWGWVLLPLSAAAMIGLIVWGRKDQDDEFLRCIWLGAVGGLIGTIGYDVFRVPFHYQGLNLLSPIRAYGMWLCGSSHSSFFTDAVGFTYHLSNGVTFGWIYALLFHKKSFWFAVAWGLVLETLAIVSPFGEVFGLRQYSNAVLLAYFAHVFYGWPLGVLCQDQPTGTSWIAQLFAKHGLAIALFGSILVGVWFVSVRPGGNERWSDLTVEVSSEVILPTWSDAPLGDQITVINPSDSEVKVGVRTPTDQGHVVNDYTIPAQGSIKVPLAREGIYQLHSPTYPALRSVFWSVSRDGDYRLNGGQAEGSNPPQNQ